MVILIRFLVFCFCFTPKPGVCVSDPAIQFSVLTISLCLRILATVTLQHASILSNTAKGLLRTLHGHILPVDLETEPTLKDTLLYNLINRPEYQSENLNENREIKKSPEKLKPRFK